LPNHSPIYCPITLPFIAQSLSHLLPNHSLSHLLPNHSLSHLLPNHSLSHLLLHLLLNSLPIPFITQFAPYPIYYSIRSLSHLLLNSLPIPSNPLPVTPTHQNNINMHITQFLSSDKKADSHNPNSFKGIPISHLVKKSQNLTTKHKPYTSIISNLVQNYLIFLISFSFSIRSLSVIYTPVSTHPSKKRFIHTLPMILPSYLR
jgi:hypothetical protein